MSLTDLATITDVAARAQTLADALAALPQDIPTPTHVTVYTRSEWGGECVHIQWLLFGGDTADDYGAQKATATEVIRKLGGTWDKEPGDLFSFTQRRGDVEYGITVTRAAVCTRVVTGTREVTSTVPDPAAPLVEVTETVEDIEWRCEPLLAEVTR